MELMKFFEQDHGIFIEVNVITAGTCFIYLEMTEHIFSYEYEHSRNKIATEFSKTKRLVYLKSNALYIKITYISLCSSTMFSSRKFLDLDIVAFLLLFDN